MLDYQTVACLAFALNHCQSTVSVSLPFSFNFEVKEYKLDSNVGARVQH